MERISLNGIWRLTGREQGDESARKISVDAHVPGNVQLDLAAGGYLPSDLFYGENIRETEKFEGYEWWYEREFEFTSDAKNVYLVFKGVDTLAEYYLNGIKIAESDNMFIAHEFKADGLLKKGTNKLTVHLSSVTRFENDRDYDIVNVVANWNSPTTTSVRNAPHCYGWDIMPRAVNSGIWRDVYIEIRDEAYFSQTYFTYREGQITFSYVLECDYADLRSLEIEIEAKCADSFGKCRFPVSTKAANRIFDLNFIKLWWPYGYGEPNVYDAVIRIYKNGVRIHEKHDSFGLRTVELVRTEFDRGGEGCFKFIVNGKEILCKGSNWVPLDAFHSRDAERYDRALALVKDIGCNILRCWGGNVYEDAKFFDFCDRNGIMIWQDFSMACNSYRQSEEFIRKIEAEATYIVRTHRQHPSLILWSGDNEIDQMNYFLGVLPSSNRISREVLRRVVERNDYLRPYLPSSPYVSDEAFADRSKSLPEDHLWGPRAYYKGDFYKQSNAHFVSETGYHGCPALESIKKFITPEKVWPYRNNSEWILHSSDQQGRDARVMLMERQVRAMFNDVPTDAERYILASQITQAEAKKYFIERIRVDRPNKSGVIWWNLLDGWPQMSDAVVDYYFTKKLAYEYIKRSQAPFILAFGELEGTERRLYACNDTLMPVSGKYKVIDAESDEILYEGGFNVGENRSEVILTSYGEYQDKQLLIIEWETDFGRGMNHYLTGYPPFSLDRYVKLMKKYDLDGEIFK